MHSSLPVRTVKDLVAMTKAHPGEIASSSSGPGGGSHLGGALLNMMARVRLLHLSYKGSALATVSVLSGESQVAFKKPTSSLPHIKSGRLRLVAVTTAQRWPLLPGTPTLNESGVLDYEQLIWNGLAVRSGTPQVIADRLHRELLDLLKSQKIATLLAQDSSLPSPETLGAFVQFLANEQKKWGPVIRQDGISAL